MILWTLDCHVDRYTDKGLLAITGETDTMEYIVAGIGRSGSNLLVNLIKKASGKKSEFVNLYAALGKQNHCVKKTHLHFKGELSCDYSAIFLYADIAGIIASLHKICVDKKEALDSVPWKIFINSHLEHLEVKRAHLVIFRWILKCNKLLAFLYLAVGDKFRFKENIASWKHSKKTLFIKYDALCSDKEDTLKRISQHLGLAIPDFVVKQRKSSKKDLPFLLRMVVKCAYSSFEKTLAP